MVFRSAAISMTLCEIATAKHYSLPLECRPFSAEGKDPRDPRMRSECVEWGCWQFQRWISTFLFLFSALSRSAQFWSSYSGYLREIRASSLTLGTITCTCNMACQPNFVSHFGDGTISVSLPFPNNRLWSRSLSDLARDIYKNATIENINFLKSLVNREKSDEVMIKKKQDQLTVCWSFLRTCLLLLMDAGVRAATNPATSNDKKLRRYSWPLSFESRQQLELRKKPSSR